MNDGWRILLILATFSAGYLLPCVPFLLTLRRPSQPPARPELIAPHLTDEELVSLQAELLFEALLDEQLREFNQAIDDWENERR